jgi:hypothetical protein
MCCKIVARFLLRIPHLRRKTSCGQKVGLPYSGFGPPFRGPKPHGPSVKRKYRFYEKVVKVKDDVAAILNSFPRAIIFALG